MQFKVKVLIAIWGFIILGVIAFFLLRKKSVPEDEPNEELVLPAVEPEEPEQPTPTTTPAKPTTPEPSPEPEQPTPTTTPAKPIVPENLTGSPDPAFRMGWPDGTKWNLRGTTGSDTQKCNDICKSLGYNYFTHNPPPADGGCGCSKSSKKLSQLNMTDHDNAKTRRVV